MKNKEYEIEQFENGKVIHNEQDTKSRLGKAPDPAQYETILAEMDGTGTENDPYIITNVDELQAIEEDTSAAYKLGNDIDARETRQMNFTETGFVGFFTDQEFYQLGFPPIVEGSETVEFDESEEELDPEEYTIDYEEGVLELAEPLPEDERLVVIYELVEEIAQGFDSFGFFGNEFTGTLDGDGHEIDGLFINRQNTTSVGLVDTAENGGTIEDLELVHTDITARSQGGGFIGINDGATLERVSFDGTIEVIGQRSGSCGGLVADFRGGTIRESRASGSITGNRSVGGLVGDLGIFNDTEEAVFIEDSYSTCDVMGSEEVGGLVGFISFSNEFTKMFSIRDSFTAGYVDSESEVGGLIGLLALSSDSEATIEVHDSYWDEDSSGQTDAVGFIFDDEDEIDIQNLTGLSTADMLGTAAESNMDALDFDEVWTPGTDPENYPRLQWQDGAFLTAEINPDTIPRDEEVTIDIEAEEAAHIKVDKVWTDWGIEVVNAAGATVNLNVFDDGIVEFDWPDVQYRADPSLVIAPNEDVDPDPKYVRGEYELITELNNDQFDLLITLEILPPESE